MTRYKLRIERWGLSLALVASILPVSRVARAQHLFPAEWSESVAFCGDGVCKDLVGPDPRAPERLSAELSGQNWGFAGGVTYGPPGPPSISVSLDARHASGLSRYLIGRVGSLVLFQFCVRQKGTPPHAVDYVPITIRMKGAAAVSGDPLPAHAEVGLGFETECGAVWGLTGNARGSNDPYNPPTSASLDKTFSSGLLPGALISAGMAAGVLIEGVPRTGATHATASIETAIGVADELIPGTATNYRDFYEIVFSPGYDALGPVAVKPSTWSEVKSLYRGDDR